MTLITDARRAQLREWGKKGGQARAAQPNFLQHQRAAGLRSAQVNDMAALGSLGAKAYIHKYGYIKFFHLWRNWRLNNPSSHQQQIAALLTDLGFIYQCEAMVLGDDIPLAVDFYLPDCNDAVIEVLGRVHYHPLFDHPNYPGTRRANDLNRLRRLERAGFRVLELDYRILPNLPLITGKIIGFLISAPDRRY